MVVTDGRGILTVGGEGMTLGCAPTEVLAGVVTPTAGGKLPPCIDGFGTPNVGGYNAGGFGAGLTPVLMGLFIWAKQSNGNTHSAETAATIILVRIC